MNFSLDEQCPVDENYDSFRFMISVERRREEDIFLKKFRFWMNFSLDKQCPVDENYESSRFAISIEERRGKNIFFRKI